METSWLVLGGLVALAVLAFIAVAHHRAVAPVGVRASGGAREYPMAVAGESHRNADGSSRQKILRKVRPGDPVTLVPEPDNPYDPQAVKVMTPAGQVGYVPRGQNARIFDALQNGKRIEAWVMEVTGGTGDKPSRGCVLGVRFPD